ncbi:MAG: hypothetical protein QNI84_11335 [Henriciella sp.]|nr:hypothetical protein [Henriciella sp.]
MAKIVLGLWATHGPTLSTTPEQWLMRLPADHKNKRLFYRGTPYDFEGLTKLRADENLAEKCTLEERTKRHAACQVAIEKLATTFEEVAPDATIIFGNDQRELFLETVMPAFTVYHGDTYYGEPPTPEQEQKAPPGIKEAEWGCKPPVYTDYPGMPELGKMAIKELMDAEFDVAQSTEVPRHEGHWSSGISHAFGFILIRIMKQNVTPVLPLITNTFFPPNQPTAKRCFNFGRTVARAIKAWEPDKRVAVVGSGGMSHFVIDEDFDAKFMAAIQARDVDYLTSIDESYFQSGTSELKNWISAAGALFETELSGEIIDYQSCYRSEAGTGTANGFISWT